MWLRGRTVISLMVLTAIAAGTVTYSFLELPGWAFTSSSTETNASANVGKSRLSDKEIDKLNKAVDLIEERYLLPTARDQLLDGAIQGMVQSLNDPNSVYKSQEEAEKYTNLLQGAFTGIGAGLRIENGAIVVEAPIKGSPAERAGLQPGDILLSVNGDTLNGMTMADAIAKIRGPKGTKAKLAVQRAGISEPIELELVRDRIDLETVSWEWSPDGIGSLWINQFNQETPAQVAVALAELESKGIQGLIVDVRDNPGGTLQSVIEVAEQFLAQGTPILQYEYKSGQRKTEYAKQGTDVHKPYPIVVLMNKGTASSAEILAGALQNGINAMLIGESTYGKGTVQVSYDDQLGDGSLIKLTVYKWLLPDGTWVNQVGVKPDLTVIQPEYFMASRLPRDHVLKYDQTSEDVKNLQYILEGVGFPADRKDGYFSQSTATALEAFQAQQSLSITGIVDESTAQRLEEQLYVNLQNPEFDTQWQAASESIRDLVESSP